MKYGIYCSGAEPRESICINAIEIYGYLSAVLVTIMDLACVSQSALQYLEERAILKASLFQGEKSIRATSSPKVDRAGFL